MLRILFLVLCLVQFVTPFNALPKNVKVPNDRPTQKEKEEDLLKKEEPKLGSSVDYYSFVDYNSGGASPLAPLSDPNCDALCTTNCDDAPCYSACDDQPCSSNCDDNCLTNCNSGCVSSCDDNCASGCDGSCVSSCDDGCDFSGRICTRGCDGTCRSSCDSGCTTGCDDNCITGCTGDCATGCDEGCTLGCDESCMSGCDEGCTASCGWTGDQVIEMVKETVSDGFSILPGGQAVKDFMGSLSVDDFPGIKSYFSGKTTAQLISLVESIAGNIGTPGLHGNFGTINLNSASELASDLFGSCTDLPMEKLSQLFQSLSGTRRSLKDRSLEACRDESTLPTITIALNLGVSAGIFSSAMGYSAGVGLAMPFNSMAEAGYGYTCGWELDEATKPYFLVTMGTTLSFGATTFLVGGAASISIGITDTLADVDGNDNEWGLGGGVSSTAVGIPIGLGAAVSVAFPETDERSAYDHVAPWNYQTPVTTFVDHNKPMTGHTVEFEVSLEVDTPVSLEAFRTQSWTKVFRGDDRRQLASHGSFLGTIGSCLAELPSPAAPAPLCSNQCVGMPQWASDSWCDDGGPGSEYSGCQLGTDCADCGARQVG